jgi:hypothetical protein
MSQCHGNSSVPQGFADNGGEKASMLSCTLLLIYGMGRLSVSNAFSTQ